MSAAERACRGFVAAAISVLLFHQSMVALLHANGQVSSAPYSLTPIPPLGVPRLADLCFWGGLYGAAFGLVLPRLPRAPMWIMGLALGLVAVVVGWFVVAPLKGQPLAAGWSGSAMLRSVLINGFWGLGVGVILPVLIPRRMGTTGQDIVRRA